MTETTTELNPYVNVRYYIAGNKGREKKVGNIVVELL